MRTDTKHAIYAFSVNVPIWGLNAAQFWRGWLHFTICLTLTIASALALAYFIMQAIKEKQTKGTKGTMTKSLTVLAMLIMAQVLTAGPPVAPSELTATLVDSQHVLLTWVNHTAKAKGARITVLRGVHFSLAGDPFWGARYSYTAWKPVATLAASMTAYVDTLPAGTDIASLRYRLTLTASGVTVGTSVVSITP